MKIKLTKSYIDNLPIEAKDYKIWDVLIPGLFIAVYSTGRKSFYCYFRLKNRQQKKAKIGDFPATLLDKARETAQKWLTIAAEGRDPIEEIKERAEKLVYSPEKDGTVAELYNKFLTDYADIEMKESSRKNVYGYWNNHIKPLLGDKKVRMISSGDISTLKIAVANKKNRQGLPMTTTANRVLEVVSSMFNQAIIWGWRDKHTNPVEDISHFKEKKRKRYPTPEEAKKLGNVLEAYIKRGDSSKAYFRKCARLFLILLYTGARRSEIRNAKWKWLDWDKAKLFLPDSKGNEPIEIEIPDPAMRILAEMYKERTDPTHPYIFEGKKHHQHLTDEKRIWQSIKKEAKLEDFRVHDMRHAFASYAICETKSLPMVGGLLHHKDGNTTNRYAHLMDDPLRAAVEDTASRISSALWGDRMIFFDGKSINQKATATMQ